MGYLQGEAPSSEGALGISYPKKEDPEGSMIHSTNGSI